MLSVFFWNTVEGYEEGHIYNVRSEDQGLMVIDSETSEARKFIEKDINGFSHWTLFKFYENRKQNCEF